MAQTIFNQMAPAISLSFSRERRYSIVLAEQNIEHVFMLIILFKTDIIIVIEENIQSPAESIFRALQDFFFLAFYGMIRGDGGMAIRKQVGIIRDDEYEDGYCEILWHISCQAVRERGSLEHPFSLQRERLVLSVLSTFCDGARDHQ